MPASVVVKMIETVEGEGVVVAAKMRIESTMIRSSKQEPPSCGLPSFTGGRRICH